MRLRVMLYLLPLALAGCGLFGGSDECDAAEFERELDALRAEINEEIGEAEASDVAACRTLPLGDKPCGGPRMFLVYSAEASDSTRLVELAAEYDRVDAERNRACDVASDCAIEAPPAVMLDGGRCVAAR